MRIQFDVTMHAVVIVLSKIIAPLYAYEYSLSSYPYETLYQCYSNFLLYQHVILTVTIKYYLLLL